MSTYLDSDPGTLIPASTTPAQLEAYVKGRLTAKGHQVVAEDTSSVPATLYVVPPATETIGCAQCREVLFFEFGNDTISVRPVNEALSAYPETLCYYHNPAGLGFGLEFGEHFTIGTPGVGTDLITGNSMRELYENLCSSSATRVTDWVWQWAPHPATNTADTKDYIVGIHKTGAPTGAGVQPSYTIDSKGGVVWDLLGGVSGRPRGAGLQLASEAALAPASSITVDLASGFILFLQINARGLAISSRCNSGYSGVIHAVWGDHQTALDSMPATSPGWEKFLSPIELMVGTDTPSNLTSTGVTAKSWAFANKAINLLEANGAGSAHPFTRVMPRGVCIDVAEGGAYYNLIPLYVDGVLADGSGVTIQKDYQIHRIQLQPRSFARGGGYDGSPFVVSSIGAIKTEDWWRYYGSAPDENLQFAGHPTPHTTLATALTRGGYETSVVLTSTAGMPSTGAIVIEGEGIPYAGISGNTLTGCTRGAYGAEKTAHAAGAQVRQGLYWIKINGGLIYCGQQIPS